MSLFIIIACSVIIAIVSIFGVFYEPGHPWMDRKRTIGAILLCIAGAIELVTIIVRH